MPNRPLLLIRTDASVRIGTGHVVRCLTLARALREAGWDCHFACRPYDGHVRDVVQKEGFVCHLLALDGAEPAKDQLDPDPDADARACLALWRSSGLPKPDALLVDHYSLDARWESALRADIPALAVIDDLANRPHDCAMLIDSTPVPEHHYRDLTPPDCQRLLGLDYAILRPEFHAARATLARAWDNWEPIRHLLVFFGGNDPDNLTGRLLPLLAEPAFRHLSVDVVIGRSNPNGQAIAELTGAHPHLTLHVQTPSMPALMARAQLALGAGGTASWERLCLGLPCIVFELADNQKAICRWLREEHLAVWGGTAAEANPERLRPLLMQTLADPAALQEMSERALSRMRKQGAAEITRHLQALVASSAMKG